MDDNVSTKLNYFGKYLLLAVAGLNLCGSTAIAQAKAAPPAAQAPAKSGPVARPLAFEVVSIRPSWRNLLGFAPEMETTQIQPDGYRAIDQPLISTIIFAYLPMSYSWTSESKPLNQPRWSGDQYDIQAKVAVADMAAWQKQGPQRDMLSAMLRSMLEDRCKLVVHWVPGQTSGYALVVGKKGPKLKKAALGDPTPPAGYPTGEKALPMRQGNTIIVGTTYFPFHPGEKRTNMPIYNISTEELARFLSDTTAVNIVDHTGLAGNYDVVLNLREAQIGSNLPEDSASDPGSWIKWDLEPLGLKLVRVNVPTRRLMIDHIERPSPN